MTENRYRAKSPPRSRGYHDPRSSTGTFYSSPFDPGYGSQPRSAIEPYQSSRHSSIYDTRPIKQYSYKDDAHPGSTVSRTEYAVRPRTNSNVPSDGRRPMSMLVRNTSPTRRPVVSNSSRDDTLASRPAPYVVREEPPRYLVPAATHSQGREHHQRHYSATRADEDRLNVGSRAGGRAKGEYHHAGGYGQKSYSNNRPAVKDDDYSYTGPREQFARDMQARAPPARESYSRRDRPLSSVEIPDSKLPTPVRREMGPPPVPRQLERLDRPEDRRSTTRPIYEDERAGELPSRRHSVRAPVVHQLRDSGYASRDDVDIRPKVRRDRIQEEEVLPKLRTRDLERERDYPRDLERDRDTRDRDRERDREREPDRDRDREKDWERPRGHDKLKHADDRRETRSRDNSPERSGVGKGIATGLGGAAIAGLAGAALKGSSKPDDASDSDSRRERRHRKHKHRDRGDDETGPRELEPSERKPAAPVDDRAHDERSRPFPKPDESASESYEDEHQRRRHRRRKHKDRDDADAGAGDVLDPRSAAADPPRSDRELAEPEDDGRYRRRPERPSSRTREPEVPELERRTVPPGEDEDDRPRRVLLVEPEKKEEFKPRGILKAPRRVPFPEDPNPTREGVAPLKDVGKDGVPNGARWTKISRVLVNPEALEKAQERFEERDEYVIVLRVVTREEIQKFAEKTREIREEREKQWQEELVEKQKHKDSEHRPHHEGGGRRPRDIVQRSSDEEAEEVAQPLLDQRPAMPGIDPRSLVNPAMAPVAPGGLPVPDIKLENHDIESANYSTNV